MRKLQDFTIKEFNQFQELITDEEPDIFSIFELFGEDASNMSVGEFNSKWSEIQSSAINKRGTKRVYNINGRRFKTCLNPFDVKAGQFVDLQYIMANDNKLQNVLSVFLLPQSRNGFGWKTHKYNDGYDVLEVREFILNNFTIGDAQALSAFFLTLSNKLLRISLRYLEKKRVKQMILAQREKEKLQSINGIKQQKL